MAFPHEETPAAMRREPAFSPQRNPPPPHQGADLMRYLVLLHEGAPMAVDTFAGPLRQIILDHPPDDVELWSVWECPPAGSLAPSTDITKQFARTWAIECQFGAGIEPEQYLAPFPAFVRHHARDELVRIWQRRRAEVDDSFMPAVLASAGVAA